MDMAELERIEYKRNENKVFSLMDGEKKRWKLRATEKEGKGSIAIGVRMVRKKRKREWSKGQ